MSREMDYDTNYDMDRSRKNTGSRRNDGDDKARRIALLGLYTALAILMGYVEALIPFSFGIPGMKLGLCNVVIVFVLYRTGWKEAVLISAIRVCVIGFLFGNLFSIAYGMTGTMFSILVMTSLKRSKQFHVIGVSAAGGTAHNIGQILIAFLVTPTLPLLWYIPVLMLAGLVTGVLIGIAAELVMRRLPQHG
ncbi:MAG: Gx transporter family protein [Eubacterium sp.]|nr:Gx transporter family protein [Eubacterium sp.]